MNPKITPGQESALLLLRALEKANTKDAKAEIRAASHFAGMMSPEESVTYEATLSAEELEEESKLRREVDAFIASGGIDMLMEKIRLSKGIPDSRRSPLMDLVNGFLDKYAPSIFDAIRDTISYATSPPERWIHGATEVDRQIIPEGNQCVLLATPDPHSRKLEFSLTCRKPSQEQLPFVLKKGGITWTPSEVCHYPDSIVEHFVVDLGIEAHRQAWEAPGKIEAEPCDTQNP